MIKMNTRKSFCVVVVTAFICLFSAAIRAATTADFCVTPEPAWVKPVAWKARADSASQGTGAVDFLLVDYQTKAGATTRARFRHMASRALNASGVEDVSSITIDFDPEYEKACLHRIVVHRQGAVTDRFAGSRISVLQREDELEYQIYDGSKTMNAFLQDIQVGDVVEYSYSVEGMNPVLSDVFASYVPLQWSVPVMQLHQRLLWLDATPLYLKANGQEIQAAVSHEGKATEYVWERKDIPALIMDENVPNWFDPYPGVYISNMNQWQAVVDWALPLYVDEPLSPDLNALVERFRNAGHTDAERVIQALDFIQSDIRYLGIEMGAMSHRPGSPDAVFRQKFGDCKDKSRLLVSVLRGMGIEAYPALVHNDNGRGLLARLPSPLMFNHVIVAVYVDGKRYWLDPSLIHQAGTLETRNTPDYEYALVIAPGQTDLQHITPELHAVHSKAAQETIDISHNKDTPADYDIRTIYSGHFADSARSQFAQNSHDKISQGYLNYLAKVFPGISVDGRFTVQETGKENKVETLEQYRIEGLWQPSEDGKKLEITLPAFIIKDHVRTVDSLIRSMPYAVQHPVSYTQRISVILPAEHSFGDEREEITDPAFHFVRKTTVSGGQLHIDFNYTSRTDFIEPERMQAYSRNIDKVYSLASYYIEKPNPAAKPSADEAAGWIKAVEDMRWSVAGYSVLLFWGLFLAGYFCVYRHDPPLRREAGNGPSGLRGMLLLHMLSVVAMPVLILVEMKHFQFLFQISEWNNVVKHFKNNEQLVHMIYVEWIMQVLFLVWGWFLLVLFFMKRHTYPLHYIIFKVSMLLFLFCDSALQEYMFKPELGELSDKDKGEMVLATISTVFWVAYLLTSKRVQATFMNTRKPAVVSHDST